MSHHRDPPGALSRAIANARAIAALAGGVAVTVAIVGYVVVADTQLVLDVHARSGSSALPAILLGAAAAVATVLGVVWFVRRHDRLSRPVRRTLGRIGIAWSVLFVVAVLWMHPKSRDAALAEPVHAGLVTYIVLILVTAVGFFPFAVLRLSRSGAE
jgi:cytochrome bd-type quinol oxidase subunit 2